MTNSRAALAAAAALAVFVGLGTAMGRASSPAFDEPLHLAAGYASWRGVPRVAVKWRSHPVFAERWAALPLLPMGLDLPLADPSWAAQDIFRFDHLFLYKNRLPPERILGAARLWTLLSWGALLAFCVFLWARRAKGDAAVAAAAPFFALCAPLLSHAALVSTDAAAAALYFAGFFALREKRPVLAGAAFGLAMASGFGAVLSLPIALTALLIDGRLGGPKLSPRILGSLFGAAAAALAVVYAGDLAAWGKDLAYTLGLVSRGWPTYLAGRFSEDGFLAYFPAALLLKTPLPLLVCAALGARALPRREKLWLLLPPAAYFAAACLSKTQAGYRYVLLVYPFMLVCAAAGWLAVRARPARWALLAWLAVSVLRVHPHYLTYFNELAGNRPDAWLVDSNLDWGQGLKALGAELEKRGNPPVMLSYFGQGDPAHYGVRYKPFELVPYFERERAEPKGAPELLAISATNLRGLYLRDRAAHAAFFARKPLFVAGRSIFVYPLTAQ